jgi:hypothetical protein
MAELKTEPQFNPVNPGSIEAALMAKIPKHTFTIPDEKWESVTDPVTGKTEQKLVSKGVREFPTDPHTITLRQLTYAEETQAFAAAEARKTSFNYEGAMRSVVAADGKPINWINNEKEIFFSGLSNKVRDLVIRAFAKVALPTVGEAQDFLASEVIDV